MVPDNYIGSTRSDGLCAQAVKAAELGHSRINLTRSANENSLVAKWFSERFKEPITDDPYIERTRASELAVANDPVVACVTQLRDNAIYFRFTSYTITSWAVCMYVNQRTWCTHMWSP